MKYEKVIPGTFISRPNRFIAYVQTDNGTEAVHVKNTGRCGELLLPGVKVWLSVSSSAARKTRCDLVAVEKERPGLSPLLVNIDSQIPNDAAEEWLRRSAYFGADAVIRREVTHGNSRFDFYIESGNRRIFLEVKGVTQENNGEARFPDAPTERGVKHLRELIQCTAEGYEAYLLFIVQMSGMKYVCPNYDTHPEFGNTLCEAADAGVVILAVECKVTPDGIEPQSQIEVRPHEGQRK